MQAGVSGAADGVRISVEGAVARIRLDRADALHALSRAMCVAMADALVAWRGDPAIELVLLDHAGGRGFCAGGDVRAAASGAGDGVAARAFFADEYRLNHLLHIYQKPVVAFMDGVTMGGGVGLAQPCRYRVATERTVWAMPETGLGLFPDVGAGWFLSRLPGRIGVFLALTGARLSGAEACALGLATHHLPSDALDGVKARLAEQPRDAAAILADAAVATPSAPITGRLDTIDRLFASDRLEDILAALAADGSDWATEQHAVLAARSPTSCKVALRQLRESALLADFVDEMRMEYGLAWHLCQRGDFAEGVRARLVDKDGAPRWHPDTPEGVTDGLLDTIFAPLPEDEAWTPLSL